MNSTSVFLLCTVLILAVTVIILSVIVILNRHRVKKLSESAEKFLSKSVLTDLSTSDNSFSVLQNYICDLENAIILEKYNAEKEIKKQSDFLSDVSHQLKTPLAGIRLYCEMRHSENPDKYSEKELLLIDRMENLIYSLLRLEKLRADTYVMNYSNNNLAYICKDIINEFKSLFPKKNFILTGESMLRCDKEWMREAIANIVKNACEHTPENGKICIEIENTGSMVMVTVEDNGGGVPEGECINLFTRFYKNSDSPKNSVGIGMAITKVITEKHHGTVSAENGLNGLKVIMCFPIIDGNLKI